MEEEEYQDERYPINQGMNGLSSAGALQYQFENPDIVDNVARVFRGQAQVYNPNTKRLEWKQLYKPMINEKGLAMIRGYLMMFFDGSKNYSLTDVDNEYIGNSVIDIGRIIRDELYDNWESYGVISYSAASFIVERVTDIAFTIKKKGENANYLKFLTKTHNVNEVQHHQSMSMPQQSQQRSGVLGMIFGKKR